MNGKYRQELILLSFFATVIIIFTILAPNKFLNFNNIQTLMFQIPEFGIITLGMMIVIITGGINLAITSISAFSGIIAAFFLTNCYMNNCNIYLIIILTLFIAVLISIVTGLLNGAIIAYIGVTPILVTLGMKIFLEGMCMRFTKGGSVSGFPEEFYFFGSGTLLKIPVSLIIFMIVSIVMYILLEKTSWGFKVYMVGNNPVAANFSGIKVKKVLMQVYVMSSLMAAIASIIMISRYNSAKVTLGSSYLLQSIAAAVLGGTNIAGGRGSVFGALIAIAIIQVISSGLNILGVNRFITDAIMGGILILVLVLNFYFDKNKFFLTNFYKREKID
jgi:simple sugar transport system permease protein